MVRDVFGLAIAGVVLLGSGSVLGQAAASRPAKAPAATMQGGGAGGGGAAINGPFAAQMQQMTRNINKLSADQRTRLRALIDAMNKELEEFRDAAVKKSKEAIAVIDSKDGAPRDALRTQLEQEQKKASDDYLKLVMSHQNAINALLTPDQRVNWETYKLNHAIWGKLGNDVTDGQRKQIKDLIDAAAKELATTKDGPAVLAINGRVVRKLVGEVLTEEQAARVFNAGPPALTGLGAIPGPKATPVDRNLP